MHPTIAFGLALLAALSTVLFGTSARAVPAFPGAEGYGATSAGGRGGHVYVVRNLCDYRAWEWSPTRPGHCDDASAVKSETLRWAIEDGGNHGPRTIVFEVGGTIQLTRPLHISIPYVTVAGQTALGEGVTLANMPVRTGNAYPHTGPTVSIATNDVVIRHIRIRPGPACDAALGVPTLPPVLVNVFSSPPPGYTNQRYTFYPDCFPLPSGIGTYDGIKALGIVDGSNRVILDHVSMSWSVDDIAGTWDGPTYGANQPQNITIQRSIVSEGLHQSVHSSTSSSGLAKAYGFLVDGGLSISLHHNVFARNSQRNPNISAEGPVELVNNLIYGFDWTATSAQNMRAGSLVVHPVSFDVRRNFYHQGKEGASGYRFDRQHLASQAPHLPLMVIDLDGFATSVGNPDFIGHSDGNLFWNPDGYAQSPSSPFDPHASVPVCHNSCSGCTFGVALDLTPDYCTNTTLSSPNHVYAGYDTSATPVVSGQTHPVTLTDADDLEGLLEDVGATAPVRDATDTRVVDHVDDFTRGVGGEIDTYPDCGGGCGGELVDAPPMDYGTSPWPPAYTGSIPSDRVDGDDDGMPDDWEDTHGFNDASASDGPQDADSDGYTNLEEYLNGTDPTP